MTQLSQVFDPNQIPPATGGQGQLPISDGNGHVVIITESEMKPTNDGTGAYLALSLQCTEGPAEGKTGVHRLNLNNQSTDATRIAYAELSAICYVVGYLQPLQDVSVLYNKPFRVVVGYQKGKETEGYTEIKKFLDINGNKPGQQNNQANPAATTTVSPPTNQAAAFPSQTAPQVEATVPPPQAPGFPPSQATSPPWLQPGN